MPFIASFSSYRAVLVKFSLSRGGISL